MSSPPIAETTRLLLRQAVLDDAPFFLEIMNSKGWLDNIGDRGVYTLEDARKYITDKILPGYETPGAGTLLCLLKSDGTLIGNTGVYVRPSLEHPDFGFAFLGKYQGKGYAHEASIANLAYAENHGIEELLAITLPTNAPSLKLLGKLGFQREKLFSMPGDPEELILLRRKKQ